METGNAQHLFSESVPSQGVLGTQGHPLAGNDPWVSSADLPQ